MLEMVHLSECEPESSPKFHVVDENGNTVAIVSDEQMVAAKAVVARQESVKRFKHDLEEAVKAGVVEFIKRQILL